LKLLFLQRLSFEDTELNQKSEKMEEYARCVEYSNYGISSALIRIINQTDILRNAYNVGERRKKNTEQKVERKTTNTEGEKEL
jgi:hypothetical protein